MLARKFGALFHKKYTEEDVQRYLKVILPNGEDKFTNFEPNSFSSNVDLNLFHRADKARVADACIKATKMIWSEFQERVRAAKVQAQKDFLPAYFAVQEVREEMRPAERMIGALRIACELGADKEAKLLAAEYKLSLEQKQHVSKPSE